MGLTVRPETSVPTNLLCANIHNSEGLIKQSYLISQHAVSTLKTVINMEQFLIKYEAQTALFKDPVPTAQ